MHLGTRADVTDPGDTGGLRPAAGAALSFTLSIPIAGLVPRPVTGAAAAAWLALRASGTSGPELLAGGSPKLKLVDPGAADLGFFTVLLPAVDCPAARGLREPASLCEAPLRLKEASETAAMLFSRRCISRLSGEWETKWPGAWCAAVPTADSLCSLVAVWLLTWPTAGAFEKPHGCCLRFAACSEATGPPTADTEASAASVLSYMQEMSALASCSWELC